MVESGRDSPLDDVPHCPRRVRHVGRGDRPIPKNARRATCSERCHDRFDAALRRRPVGRAAEETFHSQHVRARRVGREPLAEQLRSPVHTARIRSVFFDVRPVGSPVEHEVGAAMDERDAARSGRSRQGADGKCVRPQRVNRMILGGVDRVVRRAIDDDVRGRSGQRRLHRRRVVDVQIAVHQRRHVVGTSELLDDGRAQLTPSTDDDDTHQVLSEGLRPSDSPTRSLPRRSRRRAPFAWLARALARDAWRELRPSDSPTRSLARRCAGELPPSLKLRWTGRSRLPTVAAAAFNAAKVGGSLARSLAAQVSRFSR